VPNALGSSGLSLIDARDVGEVAATVLTSQDWLGQTLVLTGPRSVTYTEIAQLVAAKAGRPVQVNEVLPAEVRTRMLAGGTPAWEAEHFEEMYELFRRGESEFVTDDVQRVTGRAPRTIEAYIAETPAAVGHAA